MFTRVIKRSLPRVFVRFNSSTFLPFLAITKCRSCGIELQNKDKNKPGYYYSSQEEEDDSGEIKKPVRDVNRVYGSFLDKLDADDKALLLSNNFSSPQGLKEVNRSNDLYTSKEMANKVYEIKPDESLKECVRCRSVTYRSKFEINKDNFPIHDLNTVMATIPMKSPVVYVFGANDFPIGINPDIFRYRNPRDVFFVMTKSDNLFERNSASEKYTISFLRDYLGTKYYVPPENVYVTSGKEGWNAAALSVFIPDSAYLVGNTNCGKSTLIKALMLYNELQNRREQESKIPYIVRQKGKKKFIQEFNKKVGPGVSYVPGFTRDIMPILIDGIKTIYDVPGFTSNENIHEFYQLFKTGKMLSGITEGAQTYKQGTYKSRYQSFKGSQVVSMGGIGYLTIPENSMYQIRNVTNIDLHKFSSLQKAVNSSIDTPVALEEKFLINHSRETLSNFDKYIIPPYYGSIDLVFENIGYMNIKPVGRKNTNELMTLYIPKGLKVAIRQQIMDYIAKSFSGYDARGNKLNKENYYDKSTFALKSFNNKEPFASELIPGKGKITDCLEWTSENEQEQKLNVKLTDYAQLNMVLDVPEEHMYDDAFEVNEQNKYRFWSGKF
ncbi:GEP3 [[Candida] subhashii]|uniref:GEP3 n=1 Tax=[Candida] subhashii TaxID=561895 RepID=A0A8J5QFK8_9ASCO|nr:GEP3 [[Candida] subhashii]KAG7661258.1 GEP3 [[Candida] subhashii]